MKITHSQSCFADGVKMRSAVKRRAAQQPSFITAEARTLLLLTSKVRLHPTPQTTEVVHQDQFDHS